MPRTHLLAVALALAVCVPLVPAVAVAGPTVTDEAGDWPADRGGPGRTGTNTGDAPTGPNATIANEYTAPDADADWGEPTAPAVVDGTMYVGYDTPADR